MVDLLEAQIFRVDKVPNCTEIFLFDNVYKNRIISVIKRAVRYKMKLKNRLIRYLIKRWDFNRPTGQFSFTSDIY